MKNIIKKIWNCIVSIPKDKILHSYAAELICMFSFALLFRLITPLWLLLLIADGIALAFLIGKEIYDSYHSDTQTKELGDILAGLRGIGYFNLAALIMFI